MKVMVVPLPPKFKVPYMEVYDGSKDPIEYLEIFKTHMTLHGSQERPSNPKRSGTGLVWVPTIGIHGQIQQASSSLLDAVHGELENEASSCIPPDSEVAR